MLEQKRISKLEKELIALEKAQAKNREEPARSVLAENMFRNELLLESIKI